MRVVCSVRMEKLRGGVRFGEGVNTNLQSWYKAAVRIQVYILLVYRSLYPILLFRIEKLLSLRNFKFLRKDENPPKNKSPQIFV